MKKIFKILLFLIIIISVGSSCSTTSTVTPQTQAQLLIGSWKEVSDITTLCTDNTQNKALTNCVSAECVTVVVTSSTITFKKTGQADQLFTYTLSGNVITVTPADTVVITFLIVGTNLTVTSTKPASGSSANCKNVTTYSKI